MLESASQVSQVICEVRGSIALITLNRPKALNALSIEMVLGMRHFLQRIVDDPSVHGVVIQSKVPQVFCAGGDIKAAYVLYQQQNYEGLSLYIREEYALNQQIANFPKPVLALINGVALGGGVGISRYAKYRLVTEHARIGMPEIKIAFFPDVGAGYFLNQLEVALSRFLALTGYTLSGQDLINTGYGTHLIHSNDIEQLIASFVEDGMDAATIQPLEADPKAGELDCLKPVISCFAASTLEECLQKLKDHEHELYRVLQAYSPLALRIIWRYMELTRGMSYPEVVGVDLKLAQQMFHQSDFFEGIRTRLIHKGDRPTWQHATIHDVTSEVVESYF